MKKNLLFDAMNEIDEDMLEDVNALRGRKDAKPKLTWTRYVSAAACLCIVLIGVFAANRYELFWRADLEDPTDTEEIYENGEEHNYVFAEITTDGYAQKKIIKDTRVISEICDILHTADEAESSANKPNDSRPNWVQNDKDNSLVSDRSGTNETEKQYTIILTATDDTEEVYSLIGKTIIEENSGKNLILCDEQYTELEDLLTKNYEDEGEKTE